jgi:hypothetical protein
MANIICIRVFRINNFVSYTHSFLTSLHVFVWEYIKEACIERCLIIIKVYKIVLVTNVPIQNKVHPKLRTKCDARIDGPLE